jgi:hypothetical protein
MIKDTQAEPYQTRIEPWPRISQSYATMLRKCKRTVHWQAQNADYYLPPGNE